MLMPFSGSKVKVKVVCNNVGFFSTCLLNIRRGKKASVTCILRPVYGLFDLGMRKSLQFLQRIMNS